MGALFSSALVFAFTLVATSAGADDKSACLQAASKGQRFRDVHKLVEARKEFRICAAAVCPAVVQTDCAGWLAEVERALPSVVVTAKNRAGADLVNVKVTVDGEPFLQQLDGQAVPMNAGWHLFHFELADGSGLDQRVLIREGEGNHQVVVTLEPQPRPGAARALPPTGPETGEESGGARSTWRTVGWVLGGAGVLGLGTAAVFGAEAIAKKNSGHCVDSICDPGTVSGIKSTALSSDVAWIAGSVLLGTGVALVLLTPGDRRGGAGGIVAAPSLTASGGGALVEGLW